MLHEICLRCMFVMAKVKTFVNKSMGVCETPMTPPRSRSQDQIFWYGWKGLYTRNTHAKFKSPLSNGVKVICNVKILCQRRGLHYMPPSHRLWGHNKWNNLVITHQLWSSNVALGSKFNSSEHFVADWWQYAHDVNRELYYLFVVLRIEMSEGILDEGHLW